MSSKKGSIDMGLYFFTFLKNSLFYKYPIKLFCYYLLFENNSFFGEYSLDRTRWC